jgi:hypothetical protein
MHEDERARLARGNDRCSHDRLAESGGCRQHAGVVQQ